MAYDPMLASAILVGVVGGVAVFLNLTSDWEITRELARATDGWTAPLVVRSYRDDSKARERVVEGGRAAPGTWVPGGAPARRERRSPVGERRDDR